MLGEKQPRVQERKIPQGKPSQSAEQLAILKAVPTTAQNRPERLVVVATQQAMAKDKPNNTPPRWSPALIPCDEDEVELPQQDHDLVMPCPAPQKYNLREQAVHIIHSVIFEESSNITSIA
eukprot:689765-Ditylum_brightwellii.AAC.1